MTTRSSTEQELDAALEDLQRSKDAWPRLSVGEKVAILDEIVADLRGVEERWVAACAGAKGLQPGSYGEGEEWVYLALVYRLLRLLRGSLEELRAGGRPRVSLEPRADGQLAARVFPRSGMDRLLFAGTEAEVWLEPGISAAAAAAGQARLYREPPRGGRVCLVLGAGNVSALVPADFLYKLFVEGRVVALKPNPVNAYLGPLIEQGFRALIRRGYLRVVYGGAQEGAHLCQHPAVDELHMTGSDRTFEAIVFGPGEQGARRKAERAPQSDKPFSAELGNVSPIIVVPGPWSDDDVRVQAGRIASWFVNNAGFNCLTPRVLIQHAAWRRRQELTRELGRVLATVPPRLAYYPGAAERHARFLAAHPEAELHGAPAAADQLPWTLITCVDPTRTDEICFRSEAFCSLMAETALEAPTTSAFVDAAVELANEVLWGTLSASLLVHPKSMQDPRVAAAVERAVARLRYGTVTVNNYGGTSYYLGTTTWGAFPGHEAHDIQSGRGVVHNTLLLDRVQKTVARFPFRQTPDPTALTSKRYAEFGRRMADFEAAPSLLKVPGVVISVLRS